MYISTVLACKPLAEVIGKNFSRHEIVDSCDVRPLANREGAANLWCPIIPDTPYQRVLDISISAPWPAEFFAPGLGWLPVDASCACKYGKQQLFGDLEMNHVAWSIGRGIELSPPQQGQRLLFFAGHYAELDGLPLPPLEWHIRFDEI